MNASSKPDGAVASRPLRILHVFRTPVGGLFRHVCDLAAGQARMGHEIGILCDASTGGRAAEEKLGQLSGSATLGIWRVPMSRTLSYRDFAAQAAVARRVNGIRPHVVHGHGAKGGAYARLAPQAEDRIALYTPHGGALHYRWTSPSGAVFLALERLLRQRSHGMLFESEFGAAAYAAKLGPPGCPARVVPNGLGDEDFAPLPDTKPVYDAVFVGELRMLKGVATLIDAMAEIGRKDFRLAIAGAGSDEARFRAQAERLGLASRIDFLGHRAAREVFALGRVIVVPSLAESFPYIVLEAIAAGRPLVATRVGGIPEIFGPQAVHLVPPGDASALAAALEGATAPPAAAAALALELQNRARSLYSASRMAREITLFYGEVARGKRPICAELKTPETSAI